MSWLSRFIIKRFAVHKFDRTLAPGAGILRQFEGDGSSLTVVSYGDAFDVYQGKHRVFTFEVSPKLMVHIGWFIIWTYFVRGTWCGLKLRMWRWAVLREAGMLPESDGKHSKG